MRSIRPASPFRIRAPHFLLLVLGGLLMAATCVSSVASADNFKPFANSENWHGEVSVAIHPDNPDTMLAAAMVREVGATIYRLTLSWSFDAGDSWTQYAPGGIDSTRFDPSVAIRKRDGLWAVMNMASDTIRIIVSDDRGNTWSDLTDVSPPTNPVKHDKEHLVVDNDPESPGYGNLYAAWFTLELALSSTEAQAPNTVPDDDPPAETNANVGIEVSRAEWDSSNPSYNGALDWIDAVNVSDQLLETPYNYKSVQDPNLAVGTDGDIYLAFNLFSGTPNQSMGAPTAIGIVRGDGTGTWATAWNDPEVALEYSGFYRGVSEPENWSWVSSYPVLSVDHSDSERRGRVYLTWVENVNDGDVRIVSNSPGSGETPDFSIGETTIGPTAKSQFVHWTAVDPTDGRIWVAYYDCGDDPDNEIADFVLSASRDGGSTWTTWQANDDSLSFANEDLNVPAVEGFWGHYVGMDALDGQIVAMWMGPVAGEVGVWGESRHFADFVNRSDDTSFDFTATPYSSVPFDYDGDGDIDLFLTNPIGFGGLMENWATLNNPDVRRLTNRHLREFAFGERPEDCRGASTADFDNDGDLELFVAADESPHLYDNTGTTSEFFDDLADSLVQFGQATTDSWAGAWGDYDRDGWVDLYIARAGTVNDAPSGALGDRLLRNMGGEWLKDVTSDVGLNSVTSTTSTGAAWADADGDGNLDIFVSAAGSGESSRLLMQSIAKNQTTYEYEHTFADSSSAIPASLDNIAGASWRDLNNDGHLDLLLSGTGTGADGSRILWNDGDGDLSSTDLIDGGFASRGQELLDGDLDGAADFILAPASAAKAPGYFRNNHDDTEPSFSNYWRIAGVGTEATYTMTAISAVDIAGASNTPDGDEDLYIGRASSSDAFFYQNAQDGTDTPSNKWLKVKLDPGTRLNNAACIGTTVKAQTTLPGSVNLVQTQIVDGGRGVGGQGAPELTFGLRDTTSDVTLMVTWPDGSAQTETVHASALDSVITIEDTHTAALDTASVVAYVLVDASQNAEWVFEWETAGLCDPALDEVTIDGPVGRPGTCPALDEVTLSASDSDVEVSIYPLPDGGYQHRLVWEDRACSTPCSYTYTVQSAVASGVTAETSNEEILTIQFCAN